MSDSRYSVAGDAPIEPPESACCGPGRDRAALLRCRASALPGASLSGPSHGAYALHGSRTARKMGCRTGSQSSPQECRIGRTLALRSATAASGQTRRIGPGRATPRCATGSGWRRSARAKSSMAYANAGPGAKSDLKLLSQQAIGFAPSIDDPCVAPNGADQSDALRAQPSDLAMAVAPMPVRQRGSNAALASGTGWLGQREAVAVATTALHSRGRSPDGML